jgi:hypothetical protein
MQQRGTKRQATEDINPKGSKQAKKESVRSSSKDEDGSSRNQNQVMTRQMFFITRRKKI